MRILIVEDETLVAFDLEDIVMEAGHQVIGIAASLAEARKLAHLADAAFVDGRLNDGPTGHLIGEMLAREFGMSVIYATASPELMECDLRGGLGIMVKPYTVGHIHRSLALMADHQGRQCQPQPCA